MKRNHKKSLNEMTLPFEARALKTMRDFLHLDRSREEEKKLEPVLDDMVPEVMLSPDEYTSMCYCPVLTPLEILIEKEDYATNPDRIWDRAMDKSRAWMKNCEQRREVC